MTITSTSSIRLRAPRRESLFVVATFFGAALVFVVEPMVAKLLLPALGGSPAVWNTSVAFFQLALLAGYAYAHLLRRIASVRKAATLHLAALALAALTLPLAVTGRLGDPDPDAPVLWLLGALTLSIGAPFALLSATAPLLQSWFSRSAGARDAPNPYPLYVASNLGSLVALLAYPVIIEPFATLSAQRLAWSAGFVLFAGLVAAVGLFQPAAAHSQMPGAQPVTNPGARPFLHWSLLAAAPASLMTGVTTHLTTDIASFPFLWVVPLALYLLTFVLAFGRRQMSPGTVLTAQAVAVVACLCVAPAVRPGLAWQLALHLATFFLTALVCHQALADRKPAQSQLTMFYLALSVGGVVGGCFNAFVAPLIFSTVLEYPLVLVLACLARPWATTALTRAERRIVGLALAMAAAPWLMSTFVADTSGDLVSNIGTVLLLAAAGIAILLRQRTLAFTLVLGVLGLSQSGFATPGLDSQRSFFGVLKTGEIEDPVLGPVRLMYHGTTIHGAQSLNSLTACQPLTYYAPTTPLGQTVQRMQGERNALNMAVVGLGTGALAAYLRPSDHLGFFEIDPLVAQEARESGRFTYLTGCAKSPVDIKLGDARLTLARQPDGALDLLVIDAFSSDAVPAHLLTLEAVSLYLRKLKADGVLVLNLTNRRLELRDPVLAALRDAGAVALTQISATDAGSPIVSARTTAVVAAKSETALAGFRADERWASRTPKTPAWTDDYSNLFGAMLAGLMR